MTPPKNEDTLDGGDDVEKGQLGGGGKPKEEAAFVPTDTAVGLTTEQVEGARAIYGVNEIPVPSTPLYMLFFHQFTGFLPFLIEIAAIVSLAVQDWVSALTGETSMIVRFSCSLLP
jgi:H+-transporting ATPase